MYKEISKEWTVGAVREIVPRKINYVVSAKNLKRKKVLDFFIVLFALPIVLPISLITALIIKIDSKGPILYKQKRVGFLGQTFTLYKFRSMELSSEKNGAQFAKKNDPRVTTFGRFIRKFRIDELPQFWNVVKGDMSVIGPRPEQVSFVENFTNEIQGYQYRHVVKPGITGLAQVHNGYAASLNGTKRKLKLDLIYIKNFSLKLDLIIVWKTIKTILTGFGSR